MDICNLSHLWFLCQTVGPKYAVLNKEKRPIYRLGLTFLSCDIKWLSQEFWISDSCTLLEKSVLMEVLFYYR